MLARSKQLLMPSVLARELARVCNLIADADATHADAAAALA
jgi:hypothetical protein